MPVSVRVRFEIFKRDSFTCQYCGRQSPDVILEVDHIVPKALNGQDHPSNLLTSCRMCNRGKSDRPVPRRVQTASSRQAKNMWAQLRMMRRCALETWEVANTAGLLADQPAFSWLSRALRRVSKQELLNILAESFGRGSTPSVSLEYAKSRVSAICCERGED